MRTVKLNGRFIEAKTIELSYHKIEDEINECAILLNGKYEIETMETLDPKCTFRKILDELSGTARWFQSSAIIGTVPVLSTTKLKKAYAKKSDFVYAEKMEKQIKQLAKNLIKGQDVVTKNKHFGRYRRYGYRVKRYYYWEFLNDNEFMTASDKRIRLVYDINDMSTNIYIDDVFIMGETRLWSEKIEKQYILLLNEINGFMSSAQKVLDLDKFLFNVAESAVYKNKDNWDHNNDFDDLDDLFDLFFEDFED